MTLMEDLPSQDRITELIVEATRAVQKYENSEDEWDRGYAHLNERFVESESAWRPWASDRFGGVERCLTCGNVGLTIEWIDAGSAEIQSALPGDRAVAASNAEVEPWRWAFRHPGSCGGVVSLVQSGVRFAFVSPSTLEISRFTKDGRQCGDQAVAKKNSVEPKVALSAQATNESGFKGFAGLQGLLSDVTIERDQPSGLRSASSAEVGTREVPAPVSSQRASSGSPKPSGVLHASPPGAASKKWFLGAAAIVGLICVVLVFNGGRFVQKVEVPSASPVSVSRPPGSQSTLPTRTATPDRPTEDRPPIGTDQALGLAQIRYCVAEEIRLDAAKTVVNGYIESDVDKFNGMVADYNSRCGQFKYRKGSLESAKGQVAPLTSQLQAEGVARFPLSRRSDGASVASPASRSQAPKYLNTESLSAEEAKSLVEILASSAGKCSRGRTCEVGQFSLTPVDGDDEYLVIPRGYCGSGGCSTFLFKKSGSARWHQVASAFGSVSMGQRRVNGHRTLIVATKAYRAAGGFDEVSKEYSWTGNGYELATE